MHNIHTRMDIVNLPPKIFFCSMLDANITSVPGIQKLKFINCWKIVDTSEYQYLFGIFMNIHL